jgi:hypothetical protein
VLVARAMAECHLYMDLHPCERCGEPDFPWSVHEAAERDGQRISSYEGDCPACGTQRRFEFVVLDPNMPPPGLGGPEPSTIIDPGEFSDVGEVTSEMVGLPASPSAEQVYDAYDAAGDAVAATEEILKFIPVDANSVPEEAFTSKRGQALFAADPSRFERARVQEILSERRRALIALTHKVDELDADDEA